MEIERKWMVKSWPEDAGITGLPLIREQSMRQGYISVSPTVRIREEAERDGRTDWVLCFKSAGDREGLSREEIEFSISPDQFGQLEKLIGLPLIPKGRRTYLLPDGLHLEVNLVDEGLPTEFMYAEIEYTSEDQARSWDPAVCGPDGMADYLSDDVTGDPGQTMGAYWAATRLANA